jgi:hypothetical protein
MSESSLASLVGKSHATKLSPRTAEQAIDEEYQAFTFGRVGRRAQQRIEFRKADGYRIVLPYIDLKSIEANDPDRKFELSFLGRKITIEGNNLQHCYHYLRVDRVLEIQEACRTTVMTLSGDDTVVTRIHIVID